MDREGMSVMLSHVTNICWCLKIPVTWSFAFATSRFSLTLHPEAIVFETIFVLYDDKSSWRLDFPEF
jgi:hypothetical protein